MSLILVLKWSAKFSQRSSVGVLKTLLELEPVKILKVEKRSPGLFLWLVMIYEKWEICASLTALLLYRSLSMCSKLPSSLSICWNRGLASDFHCCKMRHLANRVQRDMAFPHKL